MSLPGGIGKVDNQLARPLDSLFDKIETGEMSLSSDGSFERALLEELQRSSEKSLASIHHAPGHIPTAPPWESIATGSLGILDGGLDVQNGTLYGAIGGQRSSGLSVGDSDIADPVTSSIYAALHPQKVVFDGDVFSTLNADVHDQGGQPLNCCDGINTPWTIDANNPLADDLLVGLESHAPVFDLPMDHVFFNGDGRPIQLSSVMDDMDVSLAVEGDQIILPNGAVFDYDAGLTSAEIDDNPWIDVRSSLNSSGLETNILIEGEFI